LIQSFGPVDAPPTQIREKRDQPVRIAHQYAQHRPVRNLFRHAHRRFSIRAARDTAAAVPNAQRLTGTASPRSSRRCQSCTIAALQRSPLSTRLFQPPGASKRIRENRMKSFISVSAIGIASGFSVSPGANVFPIAPPDDL